jgi:alanyl-tRNA synthetase
MTVSEIRQKYLDFYKTRGHAIVPSASLVPENDPTTLFTGSGMQPMVPYLLGENHPEGTRIADSQKSFRTVDIEEVGDNRHTTFFEMLGNWSLGDYFKKEQLPWVFEFLTSEIGLDPKKLYVTVFIGDEKNNLPRDTESAEIWKNLFEEKGIDAGIALIGSEADGYERGMKEGERILYHDSKKNWWSRAGMPENMPVGEPGGPDSEMFYDFGLEHDVKFGPHCHPNCDCGRFLEIGNSVFMQYLKKSDGSFAPLPKQNVDFGGGLERIAMAAANMPDIIAVCHRPIIDKLEIISGKKYDPNVFSYSAE